MLYPGFISESGKKMVNDATHQGKSRKKAETHLINYTFTVTRKIGKLLTESATNFPL